MGKNTTSFRNLAFIALIASPLFSMEQKQQVFMDTKKNDDQFAKLLKQFAAHTPPGHVPYAAGFSLQNQYNPLTIWLIEQYCDTNKISQHKILQGHEDAITAGTISHDCKRCITGARDSIVRVWDLEAAQCTNIFRQHNAMVTSVAIAPNGEQCVSSSYDGAVQVWHPETGDKVFDPQYSGSVKAVAITKTGKRCIVLTRKGSVSVLHLDTGIREQLFHEQADLVKFVALTPDGKYCVMALHQGVVKVWNCETGKILSVFGREYGVTAVAITPNGKYVMVGTMAHHANVWDLIKGEFKIRLMGHKGWITAIATTPDNNHCVTGSWDYAVRLWNIMSGECLRIFNGHKGFVKEVAISSDAQWCMSVSGDKTARLWHLGIPIKLCKALRQLTLAQLALLMDLYASVQRNHLGCIRPCDDDGNETDTHCAYRMLPILIQELIKPFIFLC